MKQQWWRIVLTALAITMSGRVYGQSSKSSTKRPSPNDNVIKQSLQASLQYAVRAQSFAMADSKKTIGEPTPADCE